MLPIESRFDFEISVHDWSVFKGVLFMLNVFTKNYTQI